MLQLTFVNFKQNSYIQVEGTPATSCFYIIQSGKIIDEVGLKGTKMGGAQVAPWHGNFIINNGNATAADVKKLVAFVQEKVKENTGFSLESEIIFVFPGKSALTKRPSAPSALPRDWPSTTRPVRFVA